MTDGPLLYTRSLINGLKRTPGIIVNMLLEFWRKGRWQKVVSILIIIIGICFAGMYGVARWYQQSEQDKPLSMGVTFIPSYAEYLGLNPPETMDALINDLGVRRFRLTSYWDQIEPQQGKYDFSQLDWQFQKAEAVNAQITLSIGLRQPRWPECHVPDWAKNEPKSVWQPQLEAFMTAVTNRYKHSGALVSYELENEYFLKNFGGCTDFSRQRLQDEFSLVKRLDPVHPVILSRSNNFPGWLLGEPRPDLVGMSVYRKVWDGTVTHDYFNYPLPSWYYAFLAGTQKILTGHDSIIHELQAEAWPPDGAGIISVPIEEQNKTMNARQLNHNIAFGKQTGMRTINLWGAEYWYYRKTILNDPSLWNAARDAFAEVQSQGVVSR